MLLLSRESQVANTPAYLNTQDKRLKMKLVALIMLLGISSRMCCYGEDLALIRKCVEAYKNHLLEEVKTIEGHCLRKQATINCLSEKPNERGKILDNFRYFYAQEAMYDKKLGQCPQVKYEKLKSIVENTDVARKHRFIDDLGQDHFEPCAAKVQKAVEEDYMSSIQNHRMCHDIESFAAEYRAKAKEEGCKAKILEHFISVLSNVGIGVLEDVRKLMGYECKINE